MRHRHMTVLGCLIVLGALLFSSTGAVAQGEAPPNVPQSDPPANREAPVVPESRLVGQAVTLYDQTDQLGGSGVTSQNFGDFPAFSSQAADDFFVPQGTGNWVIQTVGVVGAAGTPGSSVTVQVYTNTSGLPGPAPIYSRTVAPTNVVTSSFDIGLSPVLTLTSGTYWLSVQVNKNFAAGQWFWNERAVQNSEDSVWRNPANGFNTGCTTWMARVATCKQPASSTGPDLAFKLIGDNNFTTIGPVTLNISPVSKVIGSDTFALIVNGANFSAGSKVYWDNAERGTTFESAGKLSASIAAADVFLPKVVQITVKNLDGLTSNPQVFTVSGHVLFMPFVQRGP